MTDNVRNLLTFLVRKFPLDLDWDLAAALGDHGAAAGGSGHLLTFDKNEGNTDLHRHSTWCEIRVGPGALAAACN